MEKRSESDIVTKTLTFQFGEKSYEVPVLRMLQAAKWRQQFAAQAQEIAASMTIEDRNDRPDITKEEISKAIGNVFFGALLRHAEQIPGIVFSYAPSLPREEIMESAYDEQFTLAFKQIWQVAFQPFLASLGLRLETSKASASQSASSGSLN